MWNNEEGIDSVRFQALDEYYRAYKHVQPDSVLVTLDYFYELAKEKNATLQMYKVLNKKANIYRHKGQLEKSRSLYSEALNGAIQLNNPALQAVVTGNMGNIFLLRENYLKATRYYSDALKVFQEQGDEKGEADMLLGLGSVNLTIGNYDLALEYYQKSLDYYKINNPETLEVTIILMNIGLIHGKKKSYIEAEISFKKALQLLQITNDKFYLVRCYSTLAEIYRDLGHLDQGFDYANRSLAMYIDLNLEEGIMMSRLVIAQLTFKTDIEEATKKSEVILSGFTKETTNEFKKETYELLYTCYKAQNKLELSLKMHELYSIYNDSVQLKKNNFAVARETVKNDHELRLLESKRENKRESENEKGKLKDTQLKKTLIIISISLFFIAGLLFYFISTGKKNNKRRNLLLEEIESLKLSQNEELTNESNTSQLSREKIERSINRSLNETDWKVLTFIFEDPVISNTEIAKRAFLSVPGIASSLARMYEHFNIKESKYKKTSLLLEAMKISNNPISIK
jgi:tetratricopeptide (TPR) repeat protein